MNRGGCLPESTIRKHKVWVLRICLFRLNSDFGLLSLPLKLFGSSQKADSSDPVSSSGMAQHSPQALAGVWGAGGIQTRDIVKNFAFRSSPLKYQLQNVNAVFLRELN